MDEGKPRHQTIKINVDEAFRAYVAAAIGRLSYLRPKWTISYDDKADVEIQTDDDQGSVEREVRYALYREKIYAETASMRQRMHARIFG